MLETVINAQEQFLRTEGQGGLVRYHDYTSRVVRVLYGSEYCFADRTSAPAPNAIGAFLQS